MNISKQKESTEMESPYKKYIEELKHQITETEERLAIMQMIYLRQVSSASDLLELGKNNELQYTPYVALNIPDRYEDLKWYLSDVTKRAERRKNLKRIIGYINELGNLRNGLNKDLTFTEECSGYHDIIMQIKDKQTRISVLTVMQKCADNREIFNAVFFNLMSIHEEQDKKNENNAQQKVST